MSATLEGDWDLGLNVSALLQASEPWLRPMTIEDLAAIMAIERRVYDFPWTEGIFRDCLRVGYCCWVGESDGRLVGYAVMSVAGGEAHLLNLCVEPSYQGHGFGGRLLTHLMQVARRFHARHLFLEVRPTNEPARRLYQQLAFVEVGRRKDYYPAHRGREDALVLRRELDGEGGALQLDDGGSGPV